MIMPEYLTDKELACRCGCGLMPPKSVVERLYALRATIQSPLYFNGCARCTSHNLRVGGKEGSIHLPDRLRIGDSNGWDGGAADLKRGTWHRAGLSRRELIVAAQQVGFTGFGLGVTFMHLDDAQCPNLRIWKY